MPGDPHEEWVKEYRIHTERQNAGDGATSLQRRISDLREDLITTEPIGKSGILAQLDFLYLLSWNDNVRRLVRTIQKAIRKFLP